MPASSAAEDVLRGTAYVGPLRRVGVLFAGAARAANLLDTMRANPNLSTLVALIDKAGLQGQFTGPQQLTVLAPTNGAFDEGGLVTVTHGPRALAGHHPQ